MVNKAKLQYSTYMKVAVCGQVDSGISDDFESEGNAGWSTSSLIDRGRVAFQRFASTDLSEICVNRPETLRILRQ